MICLYCIIWVIINKWFVLKLNKYVVSDISGLIV